MSGGHTEATIPYTDKKSSPLRDNSVFDDTSTRERRPCVGSSMPPVVPGGGDTHTHTHSDAAVEGRAGAGAPGTDTSGGG
ncbi:hypothetical protein E2C01_010188 [Portunus trituberculatus]|uniref:Uncharacterized protein n=1 Tax=Portunus trituberculatus TaxID=210409 RepID=A0A5B7D7Y8_PORTR|nr:hypothetical protein [Portunus trituberculatus]